MTYRELPIEIKTQVENLEMSVDIKGQCMDTLNALLPNKESVLTMLVEEYAKQRIKEHEAEEALKAAGYNINELRLAYWNA